MKNKTITFLEVTNHEDYRMVTEPIRKKLHDMGYKTEVIRSDKKENPSKDSVMLITNYFWALGKLKEYYDISKTTVIYIAHGIAPWKFFNTGYSSCDYVFLSSEFERDKLFKIGDKNPDDSHTITTGWPKLDLLHSKLKNRNKIKTKVIKELNLKKEEPIIAYLPTHTIRSNPKIAGSVLSLNAIEPQKTNNFVIGIHYFDYTKEDVKKTISNFKYIWKKPNKYDLMVAADIIIGDISSVMIEALLLDVPIVHFMNNSNSLNLYQTDKYGECALGEVCKNPKKLISVIKNNLAKDPYKEQRVEWKQKLIYNEGNAVDTATEKIIEILNSKSHE